MRESHARYERLGRSVFQLTLCGLVKNIQLCCLTVIRKFILVLYLSSNSLLFDS
jgi:hypothetical protein